MSLKVALRGTMTSGTPTTHNAIHARQRGLTRSPAAWDDASAAENPDSKPSPGQIDTSSEIVMDSPACVPAPVHAGRADLTSWLRC